jgi:Sec-independent protein translocase protein TatA
MGYSKVGRSLMSISFWQLLIFVVIALILFGNIPNIIKNLSKNLNNIKEVLKKKE